jgi:hypothetical protein
MANLQTDAPARQVKRTVVESVFNERGELIEENTNIQYYTEEELLPQEKMPGDRYLCLAEGIPLNPSP